VQPLDPSPECSIPDCLICEVFRGRCDGDCRECDILDGLFPILRGEWGRCLDVCGCDTCAARRDIVREHSRREDGDSTGRVPSES
jgi:hypothetical protein